MEVKMVQIGNFHIGRYDSAHKPVLSTGEANSLWENLVARYDWDDTLELFVNFAYDQELVSLLKKYQTLLREQAKTLEARLAFYQVPLPNRSKKSISLEANSGVVKDEFIFRRFFTGVQELLVLCSTAIKISVVSESLRTLFIDFISEQAEEFDKLCKFGKKKGWLQIPPPKKIN